MNRNLRIEHIRFRKIEYTILEEFADFSEKHLYEETVFRATAITDNPGHGKKASIQRQRKTKES